MTTPDPLLRIAQDEHDQAVRLLAAHEAVCPGGCDTCRSLQAHVKRTEDQLGEFGPEAETGELF